MLFGLKTQGVPEQILSELIGITSKNFSRQELEDFRKEKKRVVEPGKGERRDLL